MAGIYVQRTIVGPLLAPPAVSPTHLPQPHRHIGIRALAYYAPVLCMNAEDIEVFHASPG